MWSSTSFPLGIWALVICAAVGSVVADGLNPISKPAAGQTVPVGQPINIKWSPGTPGPVYIKLLVNSNAQMGNITSRCHSSSMLQPHTLIVESLVRNC